MLVFIPLIGSVIFQGFWLYSHNYHHLWCGMVWTVFYEFVLYPVIRNKLPSILRRIGIISFFITLSVVFLILELLQNNYSDKLVAIKYVTIALNSGFAHSVAYQYHARVSLCSSSIQHERIVWRVYDVGAIIISYYWLLYSFKQYVNNIWGQSWHQSAWIHPVLPPGSLVQKESQRRGIQCTQSGGGGL